METLMQRIGYDQRMLLIRCSGDVARRARTLHHPHADPVTEETWRWDSLHMSWIKGRALAFWSNQQNEGSEVRVKRESEWSSCQRLHKPLLITHSSSSSSSPRMRRSEQVKVNERKWTRGSEWGEVMNGSEQGEVKKSVIQWFSWRFSRCDFSSFQVTRCLACSGFDAVPTLLWWSGLVYCSGAWLPATTWWMNAVLSAIWPQGLY